MKCRSPACCKRFSPEGMLPRLCLGGDWRCDDGHREFVQFLPKKGPALSLQKAERQGRGTRWFGCFPHSACFVIFSSTPTHASVTNSDEAGGMRKTPKPPGAPSL